MLKDLFETRGHRDSMKNRAAVDRYMREHKIDDYSLENLGHAIETVADYPGLEPSDAAIAKMPSHEYRKIVEREFKELQEKSPPKPSTKPIGINWSNFLNGR